MLGNWKVYSFPVYNQMHINIFTQTFSIIVKLDCCCSSSSAAPAEDISQLANLREDSVRNPRNCELFNAYLHMRFVNPDVYRKSEESDLALNQSTRKQG